MNSKKHVKNHKVSIFEEVHVESPKKINVGFSGTNDWIETDSVEIPFELGFYMLKLSINITYVPVSIIDML